MALWKIILGEEYSQDDYRTGTVIVYREADTVEDAIALADSLASELGMGGYSRVVEEQV